MKEPMEPPRKLSIINVNCEITLVIIIQMKIDN